MLSKALLSDGVPPLEIAFWRALFGSCLFFVHALINRERAPRGRDLAITAAFGLAGVSLLYGSYQLAIASGGASVAAVLLYTAPAFVAFLSRAWLGEKLNPRVLLAVALTITGVALVCAGSGTGVHIGKDSVAWGLTAGFTYALYYLFGKTVMARHPAAPTLAIALWIGAVGLLPFVRFGEKCTRHWLLLAVIVFAATYLPLVAYSAGLRRLSATRASVIASVEPVVAAVLAAVCYGEVLSPLATAGGTLVLVALVMAQRQ